MNAGRDEMKLSILGKAETVIYPSFDRVATETVSALALVGETLVGTKSRDWRVADVQCPRAGMFVMTLRSPLVLADDGERVVDTFIHGVKVLTRDTDAVPDYFSNEAMHSLKNALGVYRDGVAEITYESRTETVSPTRATSQRIDNILDGGEVAWTTFRGRLFRTNVPGSRKPIRFAIEQQGTGRRILCSIPHDQVDVVGRLLDKRVAVTGRCIYSRTGEPNRVEVTGLRVLSPIAFDKLPPLTLTEDGMDAADHIRRLRDAQ